MNGGKAMAEKNPIVTIEMENGDIMKAELYPEVAPNTVNNFISLVKKGFYDGIIFHRVIEGFMIQGGDPEGTGMGGPGYSIQGEFNYNGFAEHPLRYFSAWPSKDGKWLFISASEGTSGTEILYKKVSEPKFRTLLPGFDADYALVCAC